MGRAQLPQSLFAEAAAVAAMAAIGEVCEWMSVILSFFLSSNLIIA